ncbi:MAG: YbbR-like domain-containing protein [Bacteroidales bacterium]|nr:YbbR-like domain-containing protein [Bacteroidales bacterium]MCB9012864.1 YbbR-like domain-containing protein [Bacteroidales bacterium]
MDSNFLHRFSAFTETEKIALRKKIIIFLFFLVVSVILWLFIALSKPYDDQINYPVNYKNFPESKVLIGDLPDHLILSVRANGFTLLRFRLSSKYMPISFSVNSFKMNRLPGADSSYFYIATRYARDYVSTQLSPDFTINKISPDTLVFRFGKVSSKKVPVLPDIVYELDKQLILKAALILDPDSVLVSGPDFIVDTLRAVYTQKKDLGKIKKTLKRDVDLEKIKYVYFKESEVQIGFPIEQFTEKTIQVPIEIINRPENVHLQAFPRTIQLTCQVGLSNYEKLDASMFRAQVNYLDAVSTETNKLVVSITRQPVFIQALRYTPLTVDYIIEK